MRFRNPQNDEVASASIPWLWALLWAPLYFAVKGIWAHACISLALSLLTGGLSNIVYAIIVAGIVRKFYLSKGWEEV